MTMNEDTPDPFELIHREAVPAESSEEDHRRALELLQAAIRSLVPVRRRLDRRWLVPSITTLALALVVGSVGLLRPTPAEAALTEIAEAARLATPLEVPQGSFIYTRSERVDLAIRPGSEFGLDKEFVAYLLPTTREVWRQPESEFIQIRTTNHTPTFFDPGTRDAYYQHGRDATDRLGEVQTQQLTGVIDPILAIDWPTERAALHQALREYAAQGGDQRPEPAQVFELTTRLLREADPPVELRAAAVQVLAELPVDIVERTSETTTIGISYSKPQETRLTITLSTEGQLLAETTTLLQPEPDLGIPTNTIILSVEYLETRITDELQSRQEQPRLVDMGNPDQPIGESAVGRKNKGSFMKVDGTFTPPSESTRITRPGSAPAMGEAIPPRPAT